MKTKLFITAIAIVATVVAVSAQNGQGNCKGTPKCSTYVDANNDSICDNKTNVKKGTGKCDGTGKASNGKGKKFVDANNNGICDKAENEKK